MSYLNIAVSLVLLVGLAFMLAWLSLAIWPPVAW